MLILKRQINITQISYIESWFFLGLDRTTTLVNKGHKAGILCIDFSGAFDVVFNEILFPK